MRPLFNSTFPALYYPWVRISDFHSYATLYVPASGFGPASTRGNGRQPQVGSGVRARAPPPKPGVTNFGATYAAVDRSGEDNAFSNKTALVIGVEAAQSSAAVSAPDDLRLSWWGRLIGLVAVILALVVTSDARPLHGLRRLRRLFRMR